MKKLLLALALLLTVTTVEAKRNPLKQFFADCKNNYDLKQIKLGRFVFWLANKFSDSDTDEIEKAVISSIKQLRVFYLDDGIEMIRQNKEKFMKNLRKLIHEKSFERQLEIRDSESKVYWLKDKKCGHLLVVDAEDDDMQFVYIKFKEDTWNKIISSEFYSKISKTTS